MVRGHNLYTILFKVFLLVYPVGTVVIFFTPIVQGSVWDLGTVRLYGTELCIWLLFLLSLFVYGWPRIPQSVVLKRYVPWILIPVSFIIVQWAVSIDVFLATQTLRMMVSVILCSVLLYAESKKDPSLWWYAVAGSLPVFLLGIIQWGLQTTWSSTLLGLASHAREVAGTSVVVEALGGRFLRAYSVFPHPNIFGGYAAMMLCLLLTTRVRTWKTAVLSATATSLGAVALVVSWSRSAWVAFVLGAIVLCVQKHIMWRRLIPVVLVLVCSVMLYAPLFYTRTNATSTAEARSLSERRSGIATALELVDITRPFGVGLGNYTVYLHRTFPQLPGYLLQPVHVVPLIMLVELGWLGIFLWSGGVLLFLYHLGVRYQSRLLFLFILFLPILLFDHYSWTTYQGTLLFGVIIALALSSPQLFPTSSTRPTVT